MNILGIFVKRPQPGRVKTRLAADVGNERAAALYAAFIEDIADRFRATAGRRFLCYSPDDEAAREYFSQVGSGDYELWPQPDRSLGERLAAFFEHAFAAGGERVVVIGSDSPTLPEPFVQSAVDRLAAADCVLGPATDGGYYLLGQRAPGRALFNGIDWGTPRVLSQTLERVAACGAGLALLPPWYDVDTLQDLRLLEDHYRAMRQAGDAVRLEKTSAVGGF